MSSSTSSTSYTFSTSSTFPTSSTSSTKRKRVSKCSNYFVENSDHNYQNCKESCKICKKSDHKTQFCSFYRIKNCNKRHMPNSNSNDDDEDITITSNASNNNNDSDSSN